VDQDVPHRAWNGERTSCRLRHRRLRKVCTSARAAWGLMWAGRVGESAITTETTTVMSAGTESAAAVQ
jgi:hypothetical protein